MNVRKLTIEQKDLLIGKVWGANEQLFNPIQDADGFWIISEEEVQGCTLAQAVLIGCDAWLLSLPIIPYNPVILENGI